ncbi:MAG: 3-oxoacyl-[acyl-carrier-protein] reductase [Desulfobacterales bacterium S7086C20]|nr:MAG: 3-oxoacyl-[acyl-carrier-protein] reductase [Desulfobacterales bacterium S7086C20]
MNEEEKQVVVVTGGSSGIGRAVALHMAGPGTVICYNYHRSGDRRAKETAKLVEKAGSLAWCARVDVSSQADVKEFFGKIVKDYGRIDVLVNNAGIAIDGLIVRLKESDWDRVLSINLKGAFNCMQAVSKIMMKQRAGSIINMASVVGVMGNAGQASYSASKAGLIGLTKTVARELAARGITVNAVAPGFIDTAMTEGLPEKAREAMLAQIPLGRTGQPEEVAEAVAFLASRKAAYITGQVIHVNGGMYM